MSLQDLARFEAFQGRREMKNGIGIGEWGAPPKDSVDLTVKFTPSPAMLRHPMYQVGGPFDPAVATLDDKAVSDLKDELMAQRLMSRYPSPMRRRQAPIDEVGSSERLEYIVDIGAPAEGLECDELTGLYITTKGESMKTAMDKVMSGSMESNAVMTEVSRWANTEGETSLQATLGFTDTEMAAWASGAVSVREIRDRRAAASMTGEYVADAISDDELRLEHKRRFGEVVRYHTDDELRSMLKARGVAEVEPTGPVMSREFAGVLVKRLHDEKFTMKDAEAIKREAIEAGVDTVPPTFDGMVAATAIHILTKYAEGK